MKRFLYSMFGWRNRRSSQGKSASRRGVRLGVELLEVRELMSTGLTPQSLLIYYGWPSAFNGDSSLSQVASDMGKYSYVVLGAGLESPSHPDHNNTVQILGNSAMANTTVFGYVDLGVSTSNLSIGTMETDINEWKAMGVKGIFLDDFGYDFDTTRARQNTIVDYVHSQGLTVVANAFNPADAFDNVICANNPSGTKSHLNGNDYYLYEDYQVELTNQSTYIPASTWEAKADQIATYQSQIGFKVLAETTNTNNSAFSQSEFDYAWYSALLDGYKAIGWGEYQYAAVSCSAPWRTPPSVNAGTSFTETLLQSTPPGVTVSAPTRNTNLGQIEVNTGTHTGMFTPLPAAPTFTAKAISGTQIGLSWTAASGATSYIVDELVSGSWKQIASLGQNTFSYTATGLAPGTNYTFKVGAANVAGIVFAASQTVETYTAAPTLTANAVSSTQINLSWTPVTGATSYVVDELIAGAWQAVTTLNSSSKSFSVTGLTADETYYFRIGAVDAAGMVYSASKGTTTA